jgi:hypothetical protein
LPLLEHAQLGQSASVAVGVVDLIAVQSELRISGVEQWPDERLHAYAGRTLTSADVEIWPAGHTQALSGGR